MEFVEQLPDTVDNYEAAISEVRTLAVLKDIIKHSEEFGAVSIEDFQKECAKRHEKLLRQV